MPAGEPARPRPKSRDAQTRAATEARHEARLSPATSSGSARRRCSAAAGAVLTAVVSLDLKSRDTQLRDGWRTDRLLAPTGLAAGTRTPGSGRRQFVRLHPCQFSVEHCVLCLLDRRVPELHRERRVARFSIGVPLGSIHVVLSRHPTARDGLRAAPEGSSAPAPGPRALSTAFAVLAPARHPLFPARRRAL